MRADILEVGSQWMAKHHFTSDPKVMAQIAGRVEELLQEQGGYVSPSHFQRSYLELVNQGKIKSFGTFESQQQSAIPEDVITFIERSSAFELRSRYKRDPEFRKHYDVYQNQPRQAAQAGASMLTVEQYRSMPAAVVAAKYQRDPSFKAQVDSLISRGLI